MWAHTFLIGTKYPMRGIAGGKDGPLNKTVLREGSTDEMVIETTGYGVPLADNDVLMVEFGGGGGWGDPLKRDPKMVLEDVIDEYVSIESALGDYGVVIDEKTWAIDEKATTALRKKLGLKKGE
jgi:N-methylhydantoinase B